MPIDQPFVTLAVSVSPSLTKRLSDNVFLGIEQKVTDTVREVLGTDDIVAAEERLQDPKVAAELRVRLAELEAEAEANRLSADFDTVQAKAMRRTADFEAKPRTGFLETFLLTMHRLFGFDDSLQGRLAKQYILSLGSTYDAVREAAGVSMASLRETFPGLSAGQRSRIEFDIEKLLVQYRDPYIDWGASTVWDDAYRLERLLVEILDRDRLNVELDRRILEIQIIDVPLSEFYRGRVRTPKDEGGVLDADQVEFNRRLLGRLTRDLQWSYTHRELRRRYAHQAQLRVSFTFLLALVTFSLVVFWTFDFFPQSGPSASSNPGATGQDEPARGAQK